MTRTKFLRRLSAALTVAAAGALTVAVMWPQVSAQAQRRRGRGLRCQIHLTQAGQDYYTSLIANVLGLA